MDPLAEEYPSVSPYAYCLGNPIRLFDPNGREPMPGVGGPGGPMSRWMPEGTKPETYQKAGEIALNYFTPIGDIYGLFTGKTLGGDSYNRATAGTFAALNLIPFGKLAKGTGELVKVAFKYSDDVAGLVKATGKLSEGAKELITTTKSGTFSDALKVAKSMAGDLGEGAKDYVSHTGGKTSPFYDKVVGKQSARGDKYWRIDADTKTGQAHINWVNGKQKGSIEFNGGFEQAKKIIENEIFK
jgi:hypothetical protein